MDSIEMKINEFKNKISQLAFDWLDTGLVKDAIGLGAKIIEIFDGLNRAVGGFIPTLMAFIGILTAKNWMDKIVGATNSDGSKKDWWWKTLGQFKKGFGEAKDEFKKGMNEGTDESVTYMGGKFQKLGSIVGKIGQKFADSFNNSKIGSKINGVLGTSMSAGFGAGLIGVGITAAIGTLTYFLTAEQRAEEESKKIAENYKEAQANIKAATDEINKAKAFDTEGKAKTYTDLAQGINTETNANISLTTEQYDEFLSVSKEISELYPELTKGYDENGNAILDLGKDIDTVTESLKRLKDQQIADAEQKIVNNLDASIEGYKNSIKQSQKAIDKEKEKTDNNLKGLGNGNNNIEFEQIKGKNGDVKFRIKSSDIQALTPNGESAQEYIQNYLDKMGVQYETHAVYDKKHGNEYIGNEIIAKNFEDYILTYTKNTNRQFEKFKENEKAKQQKENANLNENLLSLVHQSITYTDNEDMRSSIDTIIRNIDWQEIKDKNGKKIDYSEWNKDKFNEFLTNNYLAGFDKLANSDLKDEVIQTLTLSDEDLKSTNLQEYVHNIEDLQKRLDVNGIEIPITPVIKEDKEVLANLESNLKKITKKTDDKGFTLKPEFNEDYKELKKYLETNGINTKAQIEEFNKITLGAKGAEDAIKTYEKAIANMGASSARVTKIIEDFDIAINRALGESNSKLDNGVDKFDLTEALIGKINKDNISQKLKDAYEVLNREQDKIDAWGLKGNAFSQKDFAKSKFGNIDMDNRHIINYNKRFLEANKEAMQSWDNYYDDVYNSIVKGEKRIDTVFGSVGTFGRTNIAYSPILQKLNKNGKSVDAKFISKKDMSKYLNGIVKDARKELGKNFTQEDFFKKIIDLDKQGRKVGKNFVQGMVAGVSNNIKDLDKLTKKMHFSGKDGALSIEQKKIQDAAEKASISYKQMIQDIKSAIEYSGLDKSLQNIIGNFDIGNMVELEKYMSQLQDLANAAGKSVTRYMKDYQAKELAKEIDSLWSSKDFKEKRQDLEKLARTSGITAKDIRELAAENDTLSSVLDESGMSAEYLASVLNDMCLDGSSAMDTLNADVMDLNRVFDQMADSINKSSNEYKKLQSQLEQGDYNEGYKNRQQVAKDLTEDFRNGEFGKNAKRRFYYLYANDKNREKLAQMSNQEMIDYHNARKKYVAEMETEEKNGKSVVKKTGGQNGYQFAKMLATKYGKKLNKHGIKINYSSKTGALDWNLKPEDIPYIAQLTGFSDSYVTDMFEGLGMYGNIENYDNKQYRKTLRGLSSAVTYKKGQKSNTLLSEENYRRLLEKAGLEDWDIDDKIVDLRKMKGFELLDFSSTKDKGNVKSILGKLTESGKIDKSDGLQLTELVDTFSGLGLTTDEIVKFTKAITDCEKVYDDFGNVYRKQDIKSAIEANGTSYLNANYAQLKNAAQNSLYRLEGYNKTNKNFLLKGQDLGANFNTDNVESANKELNKWKSYYDKYYNKNGTVKLNIDVEGAEEAKTVMLGLLAQKQKLEKDDIQILGADSKLIDDSAKSRFVSEIQSLWKDIDKLEMTSLLGLNTKELETSIKQQLQTIKEDDKFNIFSEFKIDEKNIVGSAKDFQDTLKKKDAVELLNIKGAIKTSETAIEKMANNVNKMFEGEQELKIKAKITGDKALLEAALMGKTNNLEKDIGSEGKPTNKKPGETPNGGGESVGNGYAHGSSDLSSDQTALVNELGNESIVRDGKLFEIKGGAHFEKLRRGDIVFDHVKTAELKKKGKLSGNGRGSIVGGMSAFSKGTFHGSVSQISNAFARAKVANPNTRDNSIDKPKSKKGSNPKKSKETFDWIEVLLSRIQRVISKLETTVNNTYQSWTAREKALKKEETSVKTEISDQQRGAKRYQKQADKYGKKINKIVGSKKGKEYIDKIKNGKISIENIDTTPPKSKKGKSSNATSKGQKLTDAIKEYQTWYNKMLECQDAIDQLKIKQSELAKQRFDGLVSKYDDKLSTLNHKKSLAEENVNYNEASRKTLTLTQQKKYDSKGKTYYETLKSNTTDRQNKLSEKKKALQDSLDMAVKNKEIKKYSTAWYEMKNAIRSVELEEKQCKTELLQYNEAIVNLRVEQFEKIGEYYDAILAKSEHFSNMLNESMTQAELQGKFITEEYYNGLISADKYNIDNLTKNLTEQKQALKEGMASGDIKKYDTNWYNMTKTINETTEAIQKNNTALKQHQSDMDNVKYDQFDYMQERIGELTDEANFLIELMSEENMFESVKEKEGKVTGGGITEQGIATLGLHGQNYNTELEKAKNNAEIISEIDEKLAKDPNNKKLLEQKKKYVQAQRESVLAANKEKQSMKSLVQEGYQKQCDAMKKLIELYTKALDSQLELFNRSKQVKEQSKNIADLEKQLKAYSNDNSEEGRTKKQELRKRIQEAKDNQKQSELEYSISEQKKMLDETYNKYEQNLNEQLEHIDSLIPQIINDANNNAQQIKATIGTEASQVGVSISDSMNEIWGSGKPLAVDISEINTGVSGFSQAIASLGETIKGAIEQSSTIASKAVSDALKETKTDTDTTDTDTTDTDTTDIKPKSNSNSNTQFNNSAYDEAVKKAKEQQAQKQKEKETDAKKTLQNNAIAKFKLVTKKFTGNKSTLKKDTSIIDRLKYFDFDSSSTARAKYYKAMGKTDKYTGSDNQNTFMLSKLKANGYATGTKRVEEDELAWTQEKGREAIVRPSNGAILTPLAKGDSVLKASATSNIFDFANNPADFINGLGLGTNSSLNVTQNAVTNNNDINFEVILPNVKNYEDLKHDMQHDKNFEKMIQSMTTDRLFGGSALKKYR